MSELAAAVRDWGRCVRSLSVQDPQPDREYAVFVNDLELCTLTPARPVFDLREYAAKIQRNEDAIRRARDAGDALLASWHKKQTRTVDLVLFVGDPSGFSPYTGPAGTRRAARAGVLGRSLEFRAAGARLETREQRLASLDLAPQLGARRAAVAAAARRVEAAVAALRGRLPAELVEYIVELL
jgi:hypothetical protein